jgi:hypothetical protein
MRDEATIDARAIVTILSSESIVMTGMAWAHDDRMVAGMRRHAGHARMEGNYSGGTSLAPIALW